MEAVLGGVVDGDGGVFEEEGSAQRHVLALGDTRQRQREE